MGISQKVICTRQCIALILSVRKQGKLKIMNQTANLRK